MKRLFITTLGAVDQRLKLGRDALSAYSEELGVHLTMQAIIKGFDKGINIAKPEIERRAATIEQQVLAAGQSDRPGAAVHHLGTQFRPALMRRCQISLGQRKFFITDKVHPPQRGLRLRLLKGVERLP